MKGATDCHMHVIGPFDRFPLAPERAYNVAEAPLEAHERMKQQVGLERTVLVQASGHGEDNRAMLAALATLGERGRGVAVFPVDSPKAQLDAMHAAGVRGLRLNLRTLPARYGGDRAQLVGAFDRLLAAQGWHLQIFADAPTLVSLSQPLLDCSVPVVIDHMGLPDAAAGIGQAGFQAVLRLLAAPHVWVKIAGADRITRPVNRGTQVPPLPPPAGRLRDAIPFMRALAEAAPERVVWGSDWPHIGFHAGRQVHDDAVLPYRAVDVAELLEVLSEAVPDPEARLKILVSNPARLYDFDRRA